MRPVARANEPEALEEPRNGAATVDFSGTAYWGGVLDVRHGGVSIPFELVIGSGLDLRPSFRPVSRGAVGVHGRSRGTVVDDARIPEGRRARVILGRNTARRPPRGLTARAVRRTG